MRCLFCNRDFESLPFWGCCGKCYCAKPEVRKEIDEAYPQTWPSASLRQEVR